MEWTDEAVATVAEMLLAKKTARQIADVFGITRNAVIGKVTRHADLYKIGFPHFRKKRPLSLEEKRARDREYHGKYRARRKAGRQEVVKPAPRPVPKVLSVEEWIAKNGVRRFERGATADYYAIVPYLAERGYTLTTRSGMKHYLAKKGQTPREVRWPEVMKLVDKFRVEDGLEPFKVAA